ncbi:CDP-alcohol phosphatidyltransferase family protein [Myxococcota bacterium]|nr:CDP-alcohol phosphatidyltransferase family protein [Myxococcota bacterium]MBU1537333.1 CDP-alcohol phosphatidyltransferase family protein [Myxococcota bacterium]
MLHLLRPLKEKLLSPLDTALSDTSPNFITFLSLIPGLLAGVAWWWGGILGLALASLFTILNGILDLLDGHLARRYKKTSALGDFLDCVVDRYTDVAILTGIAFSAYSSAMLAHVAIVAVLLVSFLGSQSQASGGGRVESGILGRAERHVLLILIPWIQILSTHLGYFRWWHFTPVEWLMITLAVLGHLTALFRIREGYVMLATLDKEKHQ